MVIHFFSPVHTVTGVALCTVSSAGPDEQAACTAATGWLSAITATCRQHSAFSESMCHRALTDLHTDIFKCRTVPAAAGMLHKPCAPQTVLVTTS